MMLRHAGCRAAQNGTLTKRSRPSEASRPMTHNHRTQLPGSSAAAQRRSIRPHADGRITRGSRLSPHPPLSIIPEARSGCAQPHTLRPQVRLQKPGNQSQQPRSGPADHRRAWIAGKALDFAVWPTRAHADAQREAPPATHGDEAAACDSAHPKMAATCRARCGLGSSPRSPPQPPLRAWPAASPRCGAASMALRRRRATDRPPRARRGVHDRRGIGPWPRA
jgi:hypothetical protein